MPDALTKESAVDEAYRILRSSVKFASGEQAIRTVLVVDVDLGAPSDVADQLATAFSRAGDRTILVDVRRDSSGSEPPGLGEMLDGSREERGATSQRSDGATMVLGPGRTLTADALASDRLSGALAELVRDGSFAIIACKSLPDHGDAIAIAPRVDATILVVSSGRTRRARAVEARDALDRVGSRVLGIVMLESKRRWFW